MTKKKKEKSDTISIKLPTISKLNSSRFLLPLTAILCVIVIMTTLLVIKTNIDISRKIAEEQEAKRPADIELIQIVAANCSDCFDLRLVINQLNTSSFNIKSVRTVYYNSPEGEQLISKYNIQKIPTLLISGETSKANVQSTLSGLGEKADDGTIVFDKQQPPYVNPDNGEVLGRVSVTLIRDSSCSNCFDVSSINQQLKSLGISFSEEKTLEYTDTEAKDLISKYGIKKIPTIIYSSDIKEYTLFAQLQQLLQNQDDVYVLTQVNPPYRDLSKNKIVGLVEITYIVDNSCSSCYDVSIHKQILEGSYGVALINEKRVDISSIDGKSLIDKYSITKVPTMILSPDASYYPALVNVWTTKGGVGTIESDGYFVFRNIDVMGVPYKDLSTGNIVNAS